MNVRCTHSCTDSVYLEWGWGEQTCIGLCCFADRKGEKSSHTMFYVCDDSSTRAGLFAGFIWRSWVMSIKVGTQMHMSFGRLYAMTSVRHPTCCDTSIIRATSLTPFHKNGQNSVTFSHSRKGLSPKAIHEDRLRRMKKMLHLTPWSQSGQKNFFHSMERCWVCHFDNRWHHNKWEDTHGVLQVILQKACAIVCQFSLMLLTFIWWLQTF